VRPLNYVGVAGGAASAGTRGSACAFVGPPAGPRKLPPTVMTGPLAKIDVEFVVVTVSDGAFLVVDHGEHDAGRAPAWRGASVTFTISVMAAGDGERSARLHSHEQAAITDKALKIGKTLIAEAAANVVRGIETRSHKVGSFGRIFPRARIAAHRQAA